MPAFDMDLSADEKTWKKQIKALDRRCKKVKDQIIEKERKALEAAANANTAAATDNNPQSLFAHSFESREDMYRAFAHMYGIPFADEGQIDD